LMKQHMIHHAPQNIAAFTGFYRGLHRLAYGTAQAAPGGGVLCQDFPPRFGGKAREALLFGVLGLGSRGIELVAPRMQQGNFEKNRNSKFNHRPHGKHGLFDRNWAGKIGEHTKAVVRLFLSRCQVEPQAG
jgi:hypothetical protein